jgi:hypothetical protein
MYSTKVHNSPLLTTHRIVSPNSLLAKRKIDPTSKKERGIPQKQEAGREEFY